MGNVIPWSQIHPSITSEEPFVAVVVIDPQRQICVSEMVPFELETLSNADAAAPELIAAAQAAAAKVASGYRARRKQVPTPALPERLKRSPGTKAPLAWADGPGKRGSENLISPTLRLPLEPETGNRGGFRVLNGGKR
jgi:hypothetical protein